MYLLTRFQGRGECRSIKYGSPGPLRGVELWVHADDLCIAFGSVIRGRSFLAHAL